MKYYINLIITFLVRFKFVILFSVFVGFILSFSLYSLNKLLFKGKREVIGITGRYTLDNLPFSSLENISLGLTRLDENLMPIPAIAESWETNDNGKTWIFTIKDNVYWQNGEKIKSSNIHLDIPDVKIEPLDDKKIIFKLESPYSPFPSVLSKPIFLKGLLGNAEWKVTKINFSGGYVNKIEIENSNKDLKIYKFYPNIERTKLAYKLGEVDKIIDLLDPKPFDSWKTSIISENTNQNQVVVIFLNTKDKILSEKRLRQALAYAINKDSLGLRALGPISPNSWAYNPQVKDYSYNVQRAKELLDELPKDFFDENNKLKLVTSPVLLEVAEKISKDWENVGIDTQIYVSSIIPSDFQAFLTILDIPPDPDQYTLWHSTQTSSNISRYTNPRIDKLLEDGRTAIEIEERKKIYFDLQRFILEDLPAIFLYHPKYYIVQRK